MTIVVIGGTQHAPLAGLEAYLRQHGMAQALPSEAGEVRTVNDWVDRYFASGVPMAQNDAAHPPPAKRSWLARMFGKAAPPPLALHAVSTPWLLSISNLVIANATQPVWGWANRRNGHLLELWLDLDPAIHFVGLITCPAHELALAQESSEAPIDAAGVLAVWRQTTEKLLAAQRQHPGRLHLVESRALNESTAAALLQSLSLSAAEEQHTPLAQALPAPDPLLASTFAQALKADAATQAVWQRVRLQLQLPAEAEHEGTEALAQAVIKLREELKSARHTSEAEAKAKQAALAERNAEAQAKQAALAERDAQAKLAQERAAAIASLQKEHSDLKAARDAEAQAKQAALAARDAEAQAKQGVTAERDALQQQLQTEKAKLTEQTEESELLLLQLHQVQEELEQYFLQAQDLKQEKEQLEQRVSRLLARLPDPLEWEELTVEAIGSALTVTVRQLQTAHRLLPHLQLVVARQKKRLTLQVVDAEGEPSPLLHGPLAAPLDPLTEPGTPGAEALGQLATTDLELLHQLCGSLATNLSASAAGRERWVADLTKLGDQLKALPLAWRYDEVQLKRAHEDPNYEHLWFQFKNASFGSRFWPNFEFRLGAANVRPGQFTEHPKLEFPDPGPGQPKQFENWFAESEDQYGPKLELRFETRRRIFDIDVWNALSAEDQRQCLVLLAATSNLLPLMQARGHELSRPWQDWQSLVANQLVILVQASQAETA